MEAAYVADMSFVVGPVRVFVVFVCVGRWVLVTGVEGKMKERGNGMDMGVLKKRDI